MAQLQKYKNDFVLLLESGFIAASQTDEDAALELFRAAQILQPENVTDFEAGVKSSFFHNRVVANFDFFTEYLTGLQANITPLGGGKSYLANVGDIRSQGVEGEVDWSITDGLTLSANGSYNDAHYTSYPNAPAPGMLDEPSVSK